MPLLNEQCNKELWGTTIVGDGKSYSGCVAGCAAAPDHGSNDVLDHKLVKCAYFSLTRGSCDGPL